MKTELFNEIWKDITGYEGLYQVSNIGRIRSVDRYVTQRGRGKQFTGLRKGRIIKQGLQNAGYLVVWLSKQGRVKAFTVHRIVANEFLEKGIFDDVNHIDGNKKNNFVANLEWCSRSKNIKHSYEKLGHRTNGKPVKCVEMNRIFNSSVEASEQTGINVSGIKNAACGRVKTAGGYTWVRV